MTRDKQYQIVSIQYELINYIYYLQYEEDYEDIIVETSEARFLVWEGSSFKVNGEEFSSKEFYAMLDECTSPITCNGFEFVKKGDVYVSKGKINIKQEIHSTTIEF